MKRKLLLIAFLILAAQGLLLADSWKCIEMMGGWKICEFFDDEGRHNGTVIIRP